MSIVIVGGNDCMVRRYMDICREYRCDSKVFTQMKAGLKSKIGNPDLMILFTNTMSHKMLNLAKNEIKGCGTRVAFCRSSSASALKNILDEHVGRAS